MEYNVRGYIPDPPNPKHWRFQTALKPKLMAAPGTDITLQPFTSPRHNQVVTSSCVAQAVVKALEIKRIMKYGMAAHVDLSRLAVYYLARELMLPPIIPPWTQQDSGTQISLACDVLRRFGVCAEKDWPFDISKVTTSPTWLAMRKAFVNKIDSFYRIDSTGDALVEDIIQCLHSGYPVVFGTAVGQNWFDYKKGQVLKTPDTIKGRHATCIVGFKNGVFIGENSWGNSWGDDGFYLIDPSYIKWSESRDFWVFRAGFEGKVQP